MREQHAVEPRDAVPYQPVEIVPDGMELIALRDDVDGLRRLDVADADAAVLAPDCRLRVVVAGPFAADLYRMVEGRPAQYLSAHRETVEANDAAPGWRQLKRNFRIRQISQRLTRLAARNEQFLPVLASY